MSLHLRIKLHTNVSSRRRQSQGEEIHAYWTGTSMATPLDAREQTGKMAYMVAEGNCDEMRPPASLLTALLVNEAVPLNQNSDLPSNDSGLGHVHLHAILAHLKNIAG